MRDAIRWFKCKLKPPKNWLSPPSLTTTTHTHFVRGFVWLSPSCRVVSIRPNTHTQNNIIFLLPANVVCEGYVFTGVCLSTGGVGIPGCIAGHMTRQYISRCTVGVSELVWRQHTGNIKCMMG